MRRFILFHNKRHPSEMGAPEVRQFLSYLASDARVSSSTQNQALNALVFLYRVVLHRDLGRRLLQRLVRLRTSHQMITRIDV